ncbi:MAG TPA: hypothetical protein VKS01_01455, partial [Bryobacteraceae bacterium]|nr:hypothetical protein [Bryobacteraceae bacterium]
LVLGPPQVRTFVTAQAQSNNAYLLIAFLTGLGAYMVCWPKSYYRYFFTARGVPRETDPSMWLGFIRIVGISMIAGAAMLLLR